MYPEFILPADQKRPGVDDRTGAIVGRTTAERFGWKIGDRVPLTARSGDRRPDGTPWEFTIVGIYDGEKKGTDTTRSSSSRYDFFDESARVSGTGQRRLVHRAA